MGKVHLSEIISSVELYRFNIGGGLCSEWGKVHLSEIISHILCLLTDDNDYPIII